VKIQRAPVKFIQNDKEHVLDEVVHKRCAGTKKREADSPSDEARPGTLSSRIGLNNYHIIRKIKKKVGNRYDIK
jgi:hypothetical protein